MRKLLFVLVTLYGCSVPDEPSFSKLLDLEMGTITDIPGLINISLKSNIDVLNASVMEHPANGEVELIVRSYSSLKDIYLLRYTPNPEFTGIDNVKLRINSIYNQQIQIRVDPIASCNQGAVSDLLTIPLNSSISDFDLTENDIICSFSDQHRFFNNRFLFFNINQAKGISFSIDTTKYSLTIVGQDTIRPVEQDDLKLLLSYDHNVYDSDFSGTLEFGITRIVGPSNGVSLLDSLKNSIDIKSSLVILKISNE